MSPSVVRPAFISALGILALASCTEDEGPTGPAEVEVFTATLSGATEVPSNGSTGTGNATLTLVGGQLLFRVDVGNIQDVTRAHIHGPAGPTTNAGIMVPLYEPPAGTTPLDFTSTRTLAQGVAPIPNGVTLDSLVVLLGNGNAYVNVHTSAFGPGEIRGQVVRQP